MPRRWTVGTRLVTLLVTLLGCGSPALAQSSWDFTASTGGWWGRPEGAETTERYDDEWFGSWVGSLCVGYYWTEHIKTELDATFTSKGDRYVQRQVLLPGARAPMFFSSEEKNQEQSVAALVTFQAGRNWWVHPYLSGGVSVDWDHIESETFPIFIGQSPILPPGVASVDERRTVARGVIAGGAKFYMSERAFFRADVRTAFGGGATHVQFRTGFGVDF